LSEPPKWMNKPIYLGPPHNSKMAAGDRSDKYEHTMSTQSQCCFHRITTPLL